ncbi:recombinase family protein [Alicyclobacillus sp. ALC3]|uniref:recombinase family protein n=1 Tax=Alicyclobacillus sp. ALC3 TaxID=2796143 RepID=UPI002379AE9C|nr:recombinase family protein [Alicyclobacillus sp. ALC3]WDL99711.1 recombinase family protein [Alicyclobacillus sp. ALC3]
MEITKHGYIRVSSKDLSAQRQWDSMKGIGINDRDIYIDKPSGKNFTREEYQSMKHALRSGDAFGQWHPHWS